MFRHGVTPTRTADSNESVPVTAPSQLPTPATVAALYLRANQVLELLPISRRCLSNWQRARRIKFYRCGRTILFKRSDIETCLEKYAVNPISEPRPRRQHVEADTITTEPTKGKRRMTRGASGAA